MGQYWFLVNLDKREMFKFYKLGSEDVRELAIHHCLSGRQFTVSTAAEFIDQRRAKAERQRQYDEDRAAEARKHGRRYSPLRPAAVYRRIEQRQSSFLAKLPVEAISICIGFADSLRDKACFALTCQDAWDIARPQIVKDLRAYETWAGDRIFCMCEYTRLDDVPPNVLDEEELATLDDVRTGKWQPPADDSSSLATYDPDCLRLTDFLNARGMKPFSYPVRVVRDWLDAHDYDDSILDDRQSSFFWSSMVKETHFDIDAAGTVLRNLTTREYVRGDAYLAARKRDPTKFSPIHKWGLANILLLRIAWTHDADGSWEAMVQQTDPHCPWAGHRFDLIAADQLPRDKRRRVSPPWKDVSKGIIKEVLRCYGW